MSEMPQPNLENTNHVESKVDPEEAAYLFIAIDRLSKLVTPAPNPEPGIQKWFKMDVPFTNLEAVDCNDNRISARAFEAKLHEQDSAHEIWEFKFSDKAQGENEKHIRGLAVKTKTSFDFLLSPIESADEEANMGAFKRANGRQVHAYYEDTLYNIDADVRQMAAGYDSIGYDSPDDPGQQLDWEDMVEEWTKTGATVPGLMEDGRLVR